MDALVVSWMLIQILWHLLNYSFTSGLAVFLKILKIYTLNKTTRMKQI